MLFNKKLSFYSSNLDYYIEQLRKGDLSYLPCIFCVFAEDFPKHKLIAAKVLNEVLNEVSFDDIYKIDRQMRETTSMEWSINWHSLNVKSFITKQMSEDEKCAVFVFATFNPNGYIREQAIQALLAYKNNLPFILLRCNDWVYQVRQSALALLPNILANANDKEIVNALPLMNKLYRSERCEYCNILSIMVSIFEADHNLIKKGLDSKDVRARRFCISILNNLRKVEGAYLFNHIKQEQDPFLRKMIFQILLKTNANIVELIKHFLNDKYPPNRILALQFLYDNKTGAELDVSEDMLMDKNAQVRVLARRIVLQNNAEFDVRQRYLDNLSANTAISLYGLGEVGLREDCNLIEKFLSNNSISVTRAAMTASMRLDSDTFFPRITKMLSSEYVGIVKTATLLIKKCGDYDFEEIFEIQNNTTSENTKIKCASLMFLAPKWKSLIYMLILIGSDFKKLDNLCQRQINRWLFSYNRSFAVASEDEQQTIKTLVVAKKRFLTPQLEKNLLFLVK